MYPVTAPAKSCAMPKDRPEYSGKPIQARRDFKVVRSAHSSAEFRKSLRKIDPGELASKILQLHAAADDVDDTGLQKPSLAAGSNDGPFEMPGVLRKADHAEKIADVVNRSAQKKPRSQASSGRRFSTPRFRTLAAGTLLVGLAGGAALALGLPDMMIADAPATRPVSTELIVTEPPLAAAAVTTLADTVPVISNHESAGIAKPFNTATPQQIAEAKDRLRLAFASGNTGIPHMSQDNSDRAVAPVYPQVSADQPATTEAVTNTAGPVANPAPGWSTPAYARRASIDPQSPRPLTQENEAVAANNSPDAVLITAATGSAPVEAAPEQGLGAYPNTGKTTASVNMRISEKKNSEIVAVIPGNTTVSFNECGKWWCGVEYEGKTGFVGQRFVNRKAQ
ncbi:SH3 domain-containing protein [Roseibium sp.]|uniref:SH3 domain-containing protein n=1 Tax=Roseibium sp. TaxID=1936156 RepID=UPI003B5151E1